MLTTAGLIEMTCAVPVNHDDAVQHIVENGPQACLGVLQCLLTLEQLFALLIEIEIYLDLALTIIRADRFEDIVHSANLGSLDRIALFFADRG